MIYVHITCLVHLIKYKSFHSTKRHLGNTRFNNNNVQDYTDRLMQYKDGLCIAS